ncbi:sulfonate ABC transporter substrate-binding protein [Aurantimonas sp. Leaf443]|uniref:sulfonate ABC transporter substrate-binding protein n=1 Tax=Aurantimonas sp. Leaf443 TaxID=1736378 RepID=UPI0006FC9D5D|nr:sulfonate ABC transporter substrate-binding protein [Aurantimonas sp. Leaf443]KQT86100.1 ABC transporter substrate-binding protein [Aurantimonas sp. Leaf443]
MRLNRRHVVAALAGSLALPLLASLPALADTRRLRIGYQKYGTLVLLKGNGLLEKALQPLGYEVEWTEFPGGPQLLEALNVGAIDFGTTGEAPPIFAQAAGAPLVYVAYEPPAPRGEAILVPKDSPLQSVAELKGRTIVLNKGSNVHYLLVKALEEAGVAYGDVATRFLPPADARAAFEQGAADAWAIWDPFLAAAEVTIEARQLRNGEGIVPNHQFYLASRDFVSGHGEALNALVAALGEIDTWAQANALSAAEELAPSVGIPADILAIAIGRQSYGVKPLDAAVVAAQQKIADTFHGLGLIPERISIADVVRGPNS